MKKSTPPTVVSLPTIAISSKCFYLLGLNVGGIASKLRYNILSEYVKTFDVCCVSETKLQNIPSTEFPEHDILSFKQKTSKHGIAVFIKPGVFTFVQKIKLLINFMR